MRNFDTDRQLCAAATPGPWVFDLTDLGGVYLPRDMAEFAAAARTGWPAALREIERLRAEVERLEEEWEQLNKRDSRGTSGR